MNTITYKCYPEIIKPKTHLLYHHILLVLMHQLANQRNKKIASFHSNATGILLLCDMVYIHKIYKLILK